VRPRAWTWRRPPNRTARSLAVQASGTFAKSGVRARVEVLLQRGNGVGGVVLGYAIASLSGEGWNLGQADDGRDGKQSGTERECELRRVGMFRGYVGLSAAIETLG
jgi:hypothetical protein